MVCICGNTRHINNNMVCPFCIYSNRRIYCYAGCIYGRFLDMDSKAEEGEYNVLYRVACPLCIVDSNVLEVVGNILYYDKYVNFLRFCCQPTIGIVCVDKEKICTNEEM